MKMGGNLSSDEFFEDYFIPSFNSLSAETILVEMFKIYEQLSEEGFSFGNSPEIESRRCTVYFWCRSLVQYRMYWNCRCYLQILNKSEYFALLTNDEKMELQKGKYSKKKIFRRVGSKEPNPWTLFRNLKEIVIRVCGEGIEIPKREKKPYIRFNNCTLATEKQYHQELIGAHFTDNKWEELSDRFIENWKLTEAENIKKISERQILQNTGVVN